VWTTAAGITEGTVFRAINKVGQVWGDGMTAKVLWDVVRASAAAAGIAKLAPHDLRRTCARVGSNDGTVPWVQAEAPMRRQRPARHRARRGLIGCGQGGSLDPPCATFGE
jgi:hypothetical protein